MCAHNQESIILAQYFYEKNPNEDELKTLVVFGIDDKLSEQELVQLLPTNGGIRKIGKDFTQIVYSTWFDAEMALNELHNKHDFKGIKLAAGFQCQQSALKITYSQLVKEFNEKTSTNERKADEPGIFVKTENVQESSATVADTLKNAPQAAQCSNLDSSPNEKQYSGTTSPVNRKCSLFLYDLPADVRDEEVRKLSKDILDISFDNNK